MKRGDKYIFEIAEIHTHFSDMNNPFKLGRVKGFSTLTFDENGISRLTNANNYINAIELLERMNTQEKSYVVDNVGVVEPSWELAKDIITSMIEERN